MPKHLPNNDATGAPQNAVRLAFEHLTRREDAPLPVIVAVSGGPDSMCLCDAILELADELRLRPVIAHLNHGLRGDEAAADADYVRTFAAQRATPCAIAHTDVQARATERKQSLELAARQARYEFLAQVAREHGAAHIALAHQADDQAETILLRLIRGTGMAGLRGMSAISPHPNDPALALVRPLLGLTRAQIEAYCAARGLAPRTDSSNASTHHQRNRIRHELLPLLETFNPGIRRVLLHLADGATSDLEIVSQATQGAYANALISANETEIVLDRAAWRGLSVGLQRETLRAAVRQLKGDVTNLKFAAIEEARAVLNSNANIGEIALMASVRVKVKTKVFTFLHTEDGRRKTEDETI
ncbi:MAG TPA: tRNA lysidine(34) synthetase TilS [Thermoflexales bacterium]|nr:tRNA lysidine(34) synthetase TilS [Thermoflexales bacterium]HQW35412.1 tRNA lysidine(34) synthetase TilS [Thermoflexales bacterium]